MLRCLKQYTILLWLPFASVANDEPKHPVGGLVNLEPLKWHYRIIIAQELTGGASAHSLLSEIKQANSAINERHITWFILTKDDIKSNYSGAIKPELKHYLNKTYFSNNQNPKTLTTAILIGKDGYVKKRTKQLELQTFFDLIDSMPMRQAEISDRIGS